MKKVNIILVSNQKRDKILMCRRKKAPYKGKLNLVGGKVEANEDNLHAAYRELEEETGITRFDICLKHLMNFQYFEAKKQPNVELQVYMGVLNKEVILIEEKNPLCWIKMDENFFDTEKFAGEGNIGHILKHANL